MRTFPASLLCLSPVVCWICAPTELHRLRPWPACEEREHHAGPSTNLTLTVDGKATTLTIAELQAMPQTAITVHNEHTKVDETYSGVLLGDLLAKYGLPVTQENPSEDAA